MSIHQVVLHQRINREPLSCILKLETGSNFSNPPIWSGVRGYFVSNYIIINYVTQHETLCYPI